MILEQLKELEYRATGRPDVKQETWELCMALWRDLPGLNRANVDVQEHLERLVSRKGGTAFIDEMSANLVQFRQHFADRKKDFTAAQMVENNCFHVLWEWRKKSPRGQRGTTDLRELQARGAFEPPPKRVKYIVEIIGADVNEIATVGNFHSLVALLNGIMSHFGTNPKKYAGYSDAMRDLHNKGECRLMRKFWKHLVVVRKNGHHDYSHRNFKPSQEGWKTQSLWD